MVFPVVLAVGALALYFLTKPKSKDSEPKTVQKEELFPPKYTGKLFGVSKKDESKKELFPPKYTGKLFGVSKKDESKKELDSKYSDSVKLKNQKIIQMKKDKRESDNDSFQQVYYNPKSVFKNSKGQKLTGKTLLSRWDKTNRKSKQEQMKFRSLSIKEQIIESKKDSVKLIKYLDEWKKQD